MEDKEDRGGDETSSSEEGLYKTATDFVSKEIMKTMNIMRKKDSIEVKRGMLIEKERDHADDDKPIENDDEGEGDDEEEYEDQEDQEEDVKDGGDHIDGEKQRDVGDLMMSTPKKPTIRTKPKYDNGDDKEDGGSKDEKIKLTPRRIIKRISKNKIMVKKIKRPSKSFSNTKPRIKSINTSQEPPSTPPSVNRITMPKESPLELSQKLLESKSLKKPDPKFKRISAVKEFVTSEKSFIAQMEDFNETYRKVLKKSKTLKTTEIDLLFPHLKEFIRLHKQFYAKLESIVGGGTDEDYFDAVLTSAMYILKEKKAMYKEYSVKISNVYDFELENLEKNKKAYAVFMNDCGKKGSKGRAGFYAGSNGPLKRLMQYKDLFKTIYSKTPDKHIDKETCRFSMVEWNHIAIEVDKFSSIKKLALLDQLIKGGKRDQFNDSVELTKLRGHNFSDEQISEPKWCIACKNLIADLGASHCDLCFSYCHIRCTPNSPTNCPGKNKNYSVNNNKRIFMKEGVARHKTIPFSNKLAKYFQINKEEEKTDEVKLILFTDSLCITKSSKKGVSVKEKNNPLDVVALIKWKSLSTGQKVEISCPDDLTILLTNPKKVERSALFFVTQYDRLNWFNEIESSIKGYFSTIFSSPEYIKIEELSQINELEFVDLEFQLHRTCPINMEDDKNQVIYHLELHRKEKPCIILDKLYNSFYTLDVYLSEIYPSKIPKIPKKPKTKNPDISFLHKVARVLNAYLKLHGVLKLPHFQEFLTTSLDIPTDLNFKLTTKNLDTIRKEVPQLKKTRSSKTMQYAPKEIVPVAKGNILYDFSPESQYELALLKGEIVEILNKINDDWYYVKTLKNEIGYCPVNYVSIIL